MRPLLLALLLTLGSFAAYGQAPDCQFTQTFTATGYGVTVSNQAVSNLGTQCVTWRLSYYADNMTALSIQVEGAPDSAGAPGTFAAVPTTACSSTVQPPCTLDGANPLTDPNHATVAFRGYYAWMALNVTVYTSSGSHSIITARMYGYKGTSPAALVRGGSGGSGVAACGTTPPTTGTAGQTCYDTAGLLWVCHPSGACTVAANWVSAVPYTGAVANVALGAHGITGAPFTGDSGSGGTTGLVPAPAAGDAAAGKYLAAGGGYGVPPGTGGAAYYQTVNNAGTPLTQRPTLNFAGTGVSCADNSGATRTDCTITGGGSSGAGSTVFSSTTTAGPDNSAAETSVIGTVTGSKTIAANTFTNGAVLQAHAQGFFSLPAISDSLTFKMKCGSTVIGSAVLTPAAGVLTNGSWRFWLDIAARGTGAGGAFITNGLVELSGSVFTDTTAQVLNTTTVAFDFTSTCAFDVTAQWGAAQSGETLQGTNVAAWFPGGIVTSVYGLVGAVSPTAHNESAPLTCAASSASSTAYTCSTSPTFTPAANDCVLLVADVASGSSPTLAVNSASALAITKQQNASTLIANDLLAGGRVLVCMDSASHWQMQGQIGNAASGGSTPPYIRQVFSSVTDAGTLNPTLNVVAGNWLAIEVGFNSGAVSSITDGTNTYQVIKTDTNAGNSCYLAFTHNSVNGPLTITANGSLTYTNMQGIEFIAPNLSGTVDASGSNVSADQFAGVPLTTTAPNDVIISSVSYNHNFTVPTVPLFGILSIARSAFNQDAGAMAFGVAPAVDTYLAGMVDITQTNSDTAVCAGAIK